jgi:uncharacterized protein (TIGR02246 family)
MENQNLEKEIFGLETKYWQAMKDNDVQTMLDLSDDPCLVAGASGVSSFDKKSFSEMMKSATYQLKDFKLSDQKVKILNDDIAIIAYKVNENLIVDGKPVSLDASEASTWIRRDGKWVCSLHTESIAGDPFGRDRMKN